jgi:hypothetical protein
MQLSQKCGSLLPLSQQTCQLLLLALLLLQLLLL